MLNRLESHARPRWSRSPWCLPELRRATAANPGGPAFSAELSQKLAANDTTRPSEPRGVVRATRTELSGSQAADALRGAWTKVHGEAPGQKTLAILTAQWAHETGRGASMLNYNFGGIKGTGPSGLSAEYRTREGWGPTERRIVDRFRAYRTAEEGAVDYVQLLSTRYGAAVQAAKEGDSAGFVRGLKARGYFTGNEQAYVRSVTRLANDAMTHGFDAVGGSRGATERTFDVSRYETPSAWAGLPVEGAWPSSGAPFVGAQAIADELGRAALRIVAADPRDGERDAPW